MNGSIEVHPRILGELAPGEHLEVETLVHIGAASAQERLRLVSPARCQSLVANCQEVDVAKGSHGVRRRAPMQVVAGLTLREGERKGRDHVLHRTIDARVAGLGQEPTHPKPPAGSRPRSHAPRPGARRSDTSR